MTYSTSAIGMKRPANNYSNCPLKKRPIKYDWNIVDNSSSSDSENTNSGKFHFSNIFSFRETNKLLNYIEQNFNMCEFLYRF